MFLTRKIIVFNRNWFSTWKVEKLKIFNIRLYKLILYISIWNYANWYKIMPTDIIYFNYKEYNFIIKSLIIQVVLFEMVNFAISKMINFEYWKNYSKLMSCNNRIIIIISFLSPPSDFIVLNYYNLKSIFILWNFKFKFKSVDWLLNLSNCFKCVLA